MLSLQIVLNVIFDNCVEVNNVKISIAKKISYKQSNSTKATKNNFRTLQ